MYRRGRDPRIQVETQTIANRFNDILDRNKGIGQHPEDYSTP